MNDIRSRIHQQGTNEPHGRWYRAKLVDGEGGVEYSGFFNTKAELDAAMSRITRDVAKQYFCQELRYVMPECAECEGLEPEQVLDEYPA